MKKTWEKPELVVLTRLEPGEGVLGDCKTQYTTGPGYSEPRCMNITGGCACRGHDKGS